MVMNTFKFDDAFVVLLFVFFIIVCLQNCVSIKVVINVCMHAVVTCQYIASGLSGDCNL